MGSVLVFCSVAGVAEGLRAAWELAHVGLLSSVGPEVGLQVLQPAVRLPAALERALVGFLSSVPPHVDDQHVLRLERLLLTTAFSPLADKRLLVRMDVVVRNVLNKLVV